MGIPWGSGAYVYSIHETCGAASIPQQLQDLYCVCTIKHELHVNILLTFFVLQDVMVPDVVHPDARPTVLLPENK